MSSPNLELFPDDLFARKGSAAPAGASGKEAPDATVVPLESAGSARPAPEDPAPEAKEPEAKEPEAKEPETTVKAKGKARKSGGKPGKTKAAAESAPAASVLKFRLMDEVSEDLDDILRCAEGQAAQSAAVETETAGTEPDQSGSMPQESELEEQSEAAIAPAVQPAVGRQQGQPWQSRARLAAIVLILLAGALAGWYFSTRTAPPAPGSAATSSPTESSNAASETEAVDTAPRSNALKQAAEPDGEPSGGPEAAAEPAATVDVVRIEEDGSVLIAGIAAPETELIVLHNGLPIGVTKADAFGQWVLLPDGPLAEGPHEFGLVIKAVEETVTLPAPDAGPDAGPEAGPGAGDEPTPAEETEEGGAAGATPAPADQESSLPAPGAAATALEGETPFPPRRPAAKSEAGSSAEDPQPNYVIQLASAPSADGAASEWQRLLKAFPTLLKTQDLAVQEAEVAGRGTVFRVRTGAYEKLAAARKACAAFRRQDQDCLVVKLLPAPQPGAPRLARKAL